MPSPWTSLQDVHLDWNLTLSGAKTTLLLITLNSFSINQLTKLQLFFFHVSLYFLIADYSVMTRNSVNLFCVFLSIVMYPKLFSALGSFAERLFVTKQLKFFFKLLENVLKERSQSNEVLWWRITNLQCLLDWWEFLWQIEIQRLYWIGWRSNFRIHERSRWQNGADVDSRGYRWDRNGTGKSAYSKLFSLALYLTILHYCVIWIISSRQIIFDRNFHITIL